MAVPLLPIKAFAAGPAEIVDSFIAPAVVAAIVAGIVSLMTERRKTFADTVTKVRNDYIKELRQTAAEICATSSCNKQEEVKDDTDYYKLLFMLNPNKSDAAWEADIIRRLKELRMAGAGDREEKLERFVRVMQADLALEWHGMMAEANKGNLNEDEKQKMRADFLYQLYQEEQRIYEHKNQTNGK